MSSLLVPRQPQAPAVAAPGIADGRSLLERKDAHRGQRAVVVLGGCSLIAQDCDFSALHRLPNVVTFLDAKALTPRVLASGVAPDYWLMLFPEKSKDNSLQHFIYRSFLAERRIGPCLRREHRPMLELMRREFDRYFEPWRLERGPHKRYRWRPDVYLPDSPCDLIARLPRTAIIANRRLLERYFPQTRWPNPLYLFDQAQTGEARTLEEYYHPLELDGQVCFRSNQFLNSAAISLYPLLHFLGLREVYFLGMDMTMLGSMEFAAPFTFKSLLHFRWFFWRTQRVFNADYRPNRPYWLRPRSEFDDAARVLSYPGMRYARVGDPWRHRAPCDALPEISFAEFFRILERA